MSTEESSIIFQRCPKTLDRKRVRAFHHSLIATVTNGVPFTCLISGDAMLRRLNRDFLGHDYPTDVLSFSSGDVAVSLGDVAISIDRAAAQAVEYHHTIEQEIEILMLHGALHLLGMDHETDRGAMARTERKWRDHFALPRALTERARPKRKSA